MLELKKSRRRVISAVSAFIFMLYCVSAFPMKSSGEEEVNYRELAEQIVVLVNEARAEEGLDPVYMVPYLCDVSYVRARETISYFSHDRPDGQSFITAMDDGLVNYSIAAENIAGGNSTPEATFEQWRNSPKHWATIMNPEYTHIGVAVTFEPNSQLKWYWEQLFVALDTGSQTSLDGQYIPERNMIVPKSSGDVNGDGEIDLYDVITIEKYLNEGEELNDLQLRSADVLADGKVNSSDVRALRYYVLGDCESLPIDSEKYTELLISHM